MIRKKKNYNRPKKMYQAGRIKEENALVAKYGLKNKLEIWKTIAKVTYFRSRAKDLAKSPESEQKVLFGKLNAIGLKVNSIADILDLKIENLLERRLPTIVVKRGIATTPQQARQMVAHKRISVGGAIINAPSYLVPVELEDTISLRQKAKKPQAEKTEQVEAPEAAK